MISTALAFLLLLAGSPSARAAEPDQPPPPAKPVKVTFYPILLQAPIFGATIKLPALPGGGGGENGEVSETTDASLNAAYMAGLQVEGHRWFVEVDGLWAALGASRDTPRLSVDADVYFFVGRGGIRLFDGLYATAGVRRISLDLAAALTLPIIGTTVEGDTSPGFWDPLVGVDWRKDLGKRLRFVADFQGGGFGVGTDVDLSADAYLDWHFARHFDLRLGYSMFYYKATIADVNIGSFQRTLVSTQTLHSPTIGLGIVF